MEFNYSLLYWCSDKEDGNSEYNEISPNEVLLCVTYFADSSDFKKNILNQSSANEAPLLRMSTSTCFNCHASKSKRIGPSFEAIAGRYPANTVSVDDLAKKIIGGSSGTWGDEKMPPHPELQIGQAKELVRWILANSSDPNQTFYTGLEGSIRARVKPDIATSKGVYILTARYVDHGLKGLGHGTKKGVHTIMLK
jgi:cytochrome c